MADNKRSPIYLQYWRDKLPKKWFTDFAAYRQENKANFAASIGCQKVKSIPASGVFAPDLLTRCLAPGPR